MTMKIDKAAISAVAGSLEREARGRLGRLWASRSLHEFETAYVFDELRESALALGTREALVHLVARASTDERTHARLCGEVARAYLPDVVLSRELQPDVQEPGVPAFPGCTERESNLLSIVRQCCFSETIAVAYLVRCRQECQVIAVRGVLTTLLKDEMTHARVGWGVLANVHLSDPERRTVANALPELFESQLRGWLAGYREESRGLVSGHGFIDLDALTDVVCHTLEHVVLLGLRELRLDVGAAERWVANRLASCQSR
jgi:hypothetical protein